MEKAKPVKGMKAVEVPSETVMIRCPKCGGKFEESKGCSCSKK